MNWSMIPRAVRLLRLLLDGHLRAQLRDAVAFDEALLRLETMGFAPIEALRLVHLVQAENPLWDRLACARKTAEYAAQAICILPPSPRDRSLI